MQSISCKQVLSRARYHFRLIWLGLASCLAAASAGAEDTRPFEQATLPPRLLNGFVVLGYPTPVWASASARLVPQALVPNARQWHPPTVREWVSVGAASRLPRAGMVRDSAAEVAGRAPAHETGGRAVRRAASLSDAAPTDSPFVPTALFLAARDDAPRTDTQQGSAQVWRQVAAEATPPARPANVPSVGSAQATPATGAFTVKAGERLSGALRQYLEAQGLHLQWNTRMDFEVQHPYRIEGPSVPETVRAILTAYGLSGTLWQGNAVVEVYQPDSEVQP